MLSLVSALRVPKDEADFIFETLSSSALLSKASTFSENPSGIMIRELRLFFSIREE